MRIALVCLLLVAGTCALPASEVAPSQDRLVEVWILNFLQQIRFLILYNNLDPVNIPRYDFNIVIINQVVELSGYIDRLWFAGLSQIRVNYINYNIVFGRLDIDVELPELFLSVGKFSARGIYADVHAKLDVQGTLLIRGLRLSGHAVLQVWPGIVNILSISPQLSIDNIQSRLTVIGSRDFSDGVNDFFNTRLPAFLIIYRNEISTVVGEIIRGAVNWWWP